MVWTWAVIASGLLLVLFDQRLKRQAFERDVLAGVLGRFGEIRCANASAAVLPSVANIGPGEEIVVALEYEETLRYGDGAFRLRFPLAITPRYIPGAATAATAATALSMPIIAAAMAPGVPAQPAVVTNAHAANPPKPPQMKMPITLQTMPMRNSRLFPVV